MHDRATHIIKELERDSSTYPPCTGTIHRNHVTIIAFILKPTARNGRLQNKTDKNPEKFFVCAGKKFMQHPRSSQPQPLHHHTSEHSKPLQL
jgi:hypothetical protein